MTTRKQALHFAVQDRIDPEVFDLDFYFDTNAVRDLLSLESSRWEAFLGRVTDLQLRGAWMPEVICELVGTNLHRKHGLQLEDVSKQQAAIRRYDQLVQRRTWHSAAWLVRYDLYHLARVPAPAWFRDDEHERYRALLDDFQALTSLGDVRVWEDEGYIRTKHSGAFRDRGWSLDIRDNWKTYVQPLIDRRKAAISRDPRARQVDPMQAATLDMGSKLVGMARALEIPDDIVLRAFPIGESFEGRIGPAAHHVISESYYVELRARDAGRSVDRNDSRDLALLDYLPCAAVFVTQEKRIHNFSSSLLVIPTRVTDLDRFIANILACP